ncbi:MAG: hypothetical protein HC822_24605 [Oscillochloris sp.]|nr:hypothetical protein [Oscillochloris sp.]
MFDAHHQPDRQRLDHQTTVAVLGLSCVIRSNTAVVIAVAEGCFAPPAAHNGDSTPQLRIDILVQGESAVATTAALTFRSHGDHFFAAGGEVLLHAHAASGYGLGFIPPATLADPTYLRHHVLEWLAFTLAGRRARIPLRGMALAYDGRAVMLVGPPAIGIATIGYAAVQAGLSVQAEAMVYLAPGVAPQIWGLARRLDLPADAVRHFSELAALTPQIQPDGTATLVVELAAGQPEVAARPVALCLVEQRIGQTSRLTALRLAELLAVVDASEQARTALESLAGLGVYRLQVGDPRSAAALIATLLEA